MKTKDNIRANTGVQASASPGCLLLPAVTSSCTLIPTQASLLHWHCVRCSPSLLFLQFSAQEMGGRGRGGGPQIAPSARALNTASASAALPHLLSEQLRGAVRRIEDLDAEFRTYRERSMQREKILKADVEVLSTELRVATRKIEFLCGIVGYDTVGSQGSGAEQATGQPSSSAGPSTQTAGSGAGPSGGSQTTGGGEARNSVPAGHNGENEVETGIGRVEGGDAEVIMAAQGANEARSVFWRDSKEMQDIVVEGFKKLMDITSVVPKLVPSYPVGDEPWPKHRSDPDQDVIRFNWNLPVTAKVNGDGVDKICNWVRASGPSEGVRYVTPIRDILDADLRERVVRKFDYVRNVIRRDGRARKRDGGQSEEGAATSSTGGEGATGEDGLGGATGADNGGGDPAGGGLPDSGGAIEDGSGGNGADGRVRSKTVSAATNRSRQDGMTQQRKRKAKGTEWDDPKYDAAWLVNAMSDYEDPIDHREGEPSNYVTRSPWWRSDVVR
ncbi:hypothetical protein C8Q80DRAFT_732820 [Daedaleopsis nitida]|nr:hypothetical protein C8Q80DRAFT_732820 [Daedaleopsis nitida]